MHPMLFQTRTGTTLGNKFVRLAKRHNRSLAGELRVAIEKHVKDHESHPRGERK